MKKSLSSPRKDYEVLQSWVNAAKILGCPDHIGQVEAVKQTRIATGVDFSQLLLSAPAQDNIKEEELSLEPSEIGKVMGIQGSAMQKGKAINAFLLSIDYQEKINGVWMPTEKGKPWCQVHHWKRGSKSGYNLKWNLNHIRSLMASNS